MAAIRQNIIPDAIWTQVKTQAEERLRTTITERTESTLKEHLKRNHIFMGHILTGNVAEATDFLMHYTSNHYPTIAADTPVTTSALLGNDRGGTARSRESNVRRWDSPPEDEAGAPPSYDEASQPSRAEAVSTSGGSGLTGTTSYSTPPPASRALVTNIVAHRADQPSTDPFPTRLNYPMPHPSHDRTPHTVRISKEKARAEAIKVLMNTFVRGKPSQNIQDETARKAAWRAAWNLAKIITRTSLQALPTRDTGVTQEEIKKLHKSITYQLLKVFRDNRSLEYVESVLSDEAICEAFVKPFKSLCDVLLGQTKEKVITKRWTRNKTNKVNGLKDFCNNLAEHKSTLRDALQFGFISLFTLHIEPSNGDVSLMTTCQPHERLGATFQEILLNGEIKLNRLPGLNASSTVQSVFRQQLCALENGLELAKARITPQTTTTTLTRSN